MRHHTITKADGSQRMLSSLCKRDKCAQKLIAIGLEPSLELLFHHDSFAYRPRRNVAGALARARERIRMGLDWLVDADIKSFFDRIPHAELRARFKQFNKDPGLNDLIARWLSIGTYSDSLFGSARGIPQGAVVSPMLCNLYLHDFDQALSQAGLPFVRYADDFLIFTRDETSAKAAYTFVEKQLHRIKLELKPEKTRVIKASAAVQFLGEALLPAIPHFRRK